jgi:hypothetical protein
VGIIGRTRRLPLTAFFLISTAALLLASCATTHRIATWAASAISHLARADGILAEQVNWDGTACLWIGDGEERIALVWPPGYTAGGTPLSVYDENGSRVAIVGHRVTLGGGLGGGSDLGLLWLSPNLGN